MGKSIEETPKIDVTLLEELVESFTKSIPGLLSVGTEIVIESDDKIPDENKSSENPK